MPQVAGGSVGMLLDMSSARKSRDLLFIPMLEGAVVLVARLRSVVRVI